MAEPTQITRTEKRKDFQTDETAKVLRAPLFATDSSHCEFIETLCLNTRTARTISKQARTAKKGIEKLQDVSYLFQKEHCEHQRNGFLQVRMAGMGKSNKKKVLKKKDFIVHFASPMCKLPSERRDAPNGTSG